jgi:uncharacterized protein
MHDLEKGHRQVFDHIRAATRHIPYVMVEMPVLPGTYEVMQGVLDELEAAGIFGINLLEFCYPSPTPTPSRRAASRSRTRPTACSTITGMPVVCRSLAASWSASTCWNTPSSARCSSASTTARWRTSTPGRSIQQNSAQSPPRTAYFSERDYFFKTAKVFGADIAPVERKFRRANYDRYAIQAEHNYLEFHPLRIPTLRGLEVEVGLSTSIYETREGETYLRELKIDYTTPEQFDVEQDL